MAQLKEEYEETKKTLEEEASKLRRVSINLNLSAHSLDSLVNGEKLCLISPSPLLHIAYN